MAGKTVLILAGNSVKFAHNIAETINVELNNLDDDKIGCSVITGTTPVDEVRAAFAELRDKKLDILVTTLLADEGVDVPAINVLMIAGGGKSFVKAIQRVGRGLRIKEDGSALEVIDVYDTTNKFLQKHAQIRLDYYTEENIFRSGKSIIDTELQ
jgi:superfamily II DNA or RNA helicase